MIESSREDRGRKGIQNSRWHLEPENRKAVILHKIDGLRRLFSDKYHEMDVSADHSDDYGRAAQEKRAIREMRQETDQLLDRLERLRELEV